MLLSSKMLFVYFFINLLPIVVLGIHELVLNQIIDNQEIPLNNKKLNVHMGETYQFHCYVSVTSKSRNYHDESVLWKTQHLSTQKNIKINRSLLTIENAKPLNDGYYTCVPQNVLYGKLYDSELFNVNLNISVVVKTHLFYAIKRTHPLYLIPAAAIIIIAFVICNVWNNRRRKRIVRIPQLRIDCGQPICITPRMADPSLPCVSIGNAVAYIANNNDVNPVAIPVN